MNDTERWQRSLPRKTPEENNDEWLARFAKAWEQRPSLGSALTGDGMPDSMLCLVNGQWMRVDTSERT